MRRTQSQGRHKKIFVVLCCALAVVFLGLAVWSLKITDITVEGMEFYTEEELVNYIFDTPLSRNAVYARVMNSLGQKKSIPYVTGYVMEFDGLSNVTITVYEKNVIGYVDYMGCHLYFDKDGMVVESSQDVWEGIPQITGLDFDHVILYQTLPVADESTFTQILNLTQLISRYDINVDKIYFDSSAQATLYIGDVRVNLGDKDHMEEKIAELSGILPSLEGLSGTLLLNNYDSTSLNPYYYFVREESLNTETVLAEADTEDTDAGTVDAEDSDAGTAGAEGTDTGTADAEDAGAGTADAEGTDTGTDDTGDE